jgi:hypothetical protein
MILRHPIDFQGDYRRRQYRIIRWKHLPNDPNADTGLLRRLDMLYLSCMSCDSVVICRDNCGPSKQVPKMAWN